MFSVHVAAEKESPVGLVHVTVQVSSPFLGTEQGPEQSALYVMIHYLKVPASHGLKCVFAD